MTGEAVALDLRTASFVTRSLAALLDLIVQVVLVYALILVVTLSSAVIDGALATGLALVGVVAVTVGYPLLLETLTRGRSLGKLAFGLCVVRDDGGPERFRHALVRALVGFGEFYLTFGSAALIASLASERGKRLGDQLAGTVVIRERVPVSSGALPVVPPALYGWAAALELSGVPDGLALEIRTFLSRAPSIHPSSRTSLSHSLADAVAARVTPPPPPGIPAEVYLGIVLAERRRRELGRLVPPQQHAPQPYPPQPYPPQPFPPQAYAPAQTYPPPSPPAGSNGSFAPPG